MIVMLCNFPPELAEAAAKTLVNERLAACVNLLQPVTSVYRWAGETQMDLEVPLLIKAPQTLANALRERLGQLHPYEVPEILALPIREEDSSPAYVAWVRALGQD